MSRHVFPSISGREVGYTFHSDSISLWEVAYRTANGPLSPQMGEFATLGDGLTQHDTERVVTLVNAGDYVASLAEYILGAPTDERLMCFAGLCDSDRSTEAARFALSVKYEEGGKARYYNVLERKVSTAAGRRHDKRWFEVKQWVDGTVDSAVGLLSGEERIHWTFDVWRLRELVSRTAYENGGAWHPSTGRYLLDEKFLPGSSSARREVLAERADLAWAALYKVTRGLRLRADAAWNLKSLRRGLAEEEAEAASQAETAAK